MNDCIPMIFIWGIKKLAYHTDCKGNVRTSNNKIIQFPNQPSILLKIRYRLPLIWYKFSIGIHGCINRLWTHQPNFLQNIHGILSPRYNNTIIGLCYLNTQEIFEFAKIFGLKMVTEMLFQLRDAMVVTTYKKYVINIYYQVNTSNTRVLIKDRMICFTLSHTKLLNNIAKLSKPGPRRLF